MIPLRREIVRVSPARLWYHCTSGEFRCADTRYGSIPQKAGKHKRERGPETLAVAREMVRGKDLEAGLRHTMPASEGLRGAVSVIACGPKRMR
jgi:hypothetical protein